jgi:hypothetical protein
MPGSGLVSSRLTVGPADVRQVRVSTVTQPTYPTYPGHPQLNHQPTRSLLHLFVCHIYPIDLDATTLSRRSAGSCQLIPLAAGAR